MVGAHSFPQISGVVGLRPLQSTREVDLYPLLVSGVGHRPLRTREVVHLLLQITAVDPHHRPLIVAVIPLVVDPLLAVEVDPLRLLQVSGLDPPLSAEEGHPRPHPIKELVLARP